MSNSHFATEPLSPVISQKLEKSILQRISDRISKKQSNTEFHQDRAPKKSPFSIRKTKSFLSMNSTTPSTGTKNVASPKKNATNGRSASATSSHIISSPKDFEHIVKGSNSIHHTPRTVHRSVSQDDSSEIAHQLDVLSKINTISLDSLPQISNASLLTQKEGQNASSDEFDFGNHSHAVAISTDTTFTDRVDDSPLSTQDSKWSLDYYESVRTSVSSYGSYAKKQADDAPGSIYLTSVISRRPTGEASILSSESQITVAEEDIPSVLPSLQPLESRLLQVKIYFDSGPKHEVEAMSVLADKNELTTLGQLCNLIFYEILQLHLLLFNSVKLFMVYKDSRIPPVPLNCHKQHFQALDLARDELILDYIKTQERVYIKAVL